MSINLVLLRKIVKIKIDFQLADESLAMTHNLYESLKPAIRNREDAVFGHIIGSVHESAMNIFTLTLRRHPTQEELNEIGEVIKNNITRIKSRINATLT